MSLIHPTAIIGDEVTLGENVSVGAYSVVEGKRQLVTIRCCTRMWRLLVKQRSAMVVRFFHLLLLATSLKIKKILWRTQPAGHR